MPAELPTLFVSHGAPTMILEEGPARAFLAGLGGEIGRPRAVLCVSAHWETETPSVSHVQEPATIHDFYGFPHALYEVHYPAPGAPDLAEDAAELIAAAGFDCHRDDGRGLDHGAWVPMMLMYPGADVAVTQLSVQWRVGPAHHLEVGRALAPLRRDGVLVLASGGAVHNLRAFRPGGATVDPWAQDFEDWLVGRVTEGDGESLVNYRALNRNGEIAHPRDEHYLPLLVALGAAGEGARGRVLHRGFEHGSLSMAAFAFA